MAAWWALLCCLTFMEISVAWKCNLCHRFVGPPAPKPPNADIVVGGCGEEDEVCKEKERESLVHLCSNVTRGPRHKFKFFDEWDKVKCHEKSHCCHCDKNRYIWHRCSFSDKTSDKMITKVLQAIGSCQPPIV